MPHPQPGPSDPDRSAPPPPRPAPAGLQAGQGPLDHLWGAAPSRDEPPGPPRPHQRRGRPLPAGTTRRAGPSRRQEAGPHPRRRWPSRPRPQFQHPTGRGIGYDYLHSAVDDRSRVAFSQILPDETALTTALFLIEAASFFADHGVRIERILTDNAKAYVESALFTETAAGLGIGLKRTRPFRPQTTGRVERFNKTLLAEWAYARPDRSNTERRRAFRRWLRFYHHQRPHTSLDGLTPMAALVNNAGANHS
jgi:transposase InsO family protein